MLFTLAGGAFVDGGLIPALYTCDGEDISPPLSWEGAPPGTVSFALICEDPDAPGGTWVHWVLWNLPCGRTSLEEGVPAVPELAGEARQGLNSWGRIGWGGPCPPSGTHRYEFRVYALDCMLDPRARYTAGDLRKAMGGHILQEALLTGLYARSR